MAKAKGGFGKVDNRIIRDSTLTPEARLIYTLLAGYANTDRQCYPSVKHLIQESGMSSARFYKHIELLTERGIVKKERLKEGNLCRGTLYTLCDFENSPEHGQNDTH